MSVVKREGRGRKRKRLPSPASGSEGGLFPTPSVTVPAPAVAPNPRLETSQFERLVADGFDPGAQVVFSYKEERIEISAEVLLHGTSPGWLLSALGAGADGSGLCFAVPEDTPVAAEWAPAFWRVLQLLKQKVSLAEGFASQLQLLPCAFLACHLLGLEKCLQDLKKAAQRRPEALLKAARTDGQVLLHAMDLGLTTRPTGPNRPGGASSLLEAAQQLLRCSWKRPGELAVAVQERNLFHFFHAARLLRNKDFQQLLRLAATHPSALAAGLAAGFSGQLSPSQASTLHSALDGELDRDAVERMIHVAAQGQMIHVLGICVVKQDINSYSARGQTPAMLAAAMGHVETLRYLMRKHADVTLKSSAGTALEMAKRHGHAEVVRLLRDPFSRLA